MYIAINPERKFNLIILLLVEFILITLMQFQSALLHLINQIGQLIATFILLPNWLNRLGLFASHWSMGLFYALILWFFLWGFKHKLIAAWVLLTYLGGTAVGLFLQKTMTVLPLQITTTIINQRVLILTIISSCLMTALSTLIRQVNKQRVLKVSLWIVNFWLIVTLLKTKTATVSTLLTSTIFAQAWLQFCQAQYLVQFKQLQNWPLFRHSDYN